MTRPRCHRHPDREADVLARSGATHPPMCAECCDRWRGLPVPGEQMELEDDTALALGLALGEEDHQR